MPCTLPHAEEEIKPQSPVVEADREGPSAEVEVVRAPKTCHKLL